VQEQDPDAHDTSLARVLHARSAASVEDLQASLAEARRRRALGGSSEDACLAAVVSERALVAAPVLAEAARAVGGGPDAITKGPISGEELQRPPDQFALPPQLGPFRLRRELARGGMGAVWEVEHIETGQLYALKTILAAGRLQGPGGEAMVRFRREVELGARLDHPYVVRVHSADVEGDPPWLVQTYLPGGSLDERLKRQGPLPVEEAAAVTAKVARGLAHAHARGVLHRDLKPPNVLFDAEGQPRVVDFGVARSLREGTMRLTATGEVLGSPAFMAPEQALGEKAIDARADVHALGALLYALLTGGPPFKARTSLEVIEQVISKPAPPPSASRAGVPPAVDAVALRCLEKDPAARFQTADEVAAALEAWLAPVEAPKRRALPRMTLVAAALIAVGSAVVSVTFVRRTPAPPPNERPTAPTAAPVATSLPSGSVVPTSWLETLQGFERFGFSWRDSVDGVEGGLSLTLDRVEPVLVQGQELRVRLKVARLAYYASLGEQAFSHDSIYGPHPLSDEAGGPMRKGLGFVNETAAAVLELRLERRTGAVLELGGVPATPVLTEKDLERKLEAFAFHRLTGYLAADVLAAQLDNVLRVLPAEPAARWTVDRTLVPHGELTVTCPVETRPGRTHGTFELGCRSASAFGFGARMKDSSPTRKRNPRLRGQLRVEGDRFLESTLEFEVTSFDSDLFTGETTPQERRWVFRFAPGDPPPPPGNAPTPPPGWKPPGGQ
jgi:serine/threonine protein kinase